MYTRRYKNTALTAMTDRRRVCCSCWAEQEILEVCLPTETSRQQSGNKFFHCCNAISCETDILRLELSSLRNRDQSVVASTTCVKPTYGVWSC